jgi:hypothetical protein
VLWFVKMPSGREVRLLTATPAKRKRYCTFDDGHAGTPLPSLVFDFVGNAKTQSQAAKS